jgi:lysophospholipase L1-like esterase
MLLSADFATDPLAAGWTAEASTGAPAPIWSDAGGHSGPHCLFATAGKWESPAFPVTPFDYYRLDFWARAAGVEYFAAFFYDEHGQALVADHYSSVDPTADWKLQTLCFRAKAGAVTARIIFQPLGGHAMYVDDVTVRPVTRAQATAWADEVYQKIPPVGRGLVPRPPLDSPEGAAQVRALQRTFARLRRGGTLRVVMLGDSIINDTGSSPWDLLVERQYPGAHLEVVTAVSGSKGSWYYQDDHRVQSYVLDYDPNLVIIGGISQRGDLEAIRTVIHQVRAQSPAEILLMSGIFGKGEDPRTRPALLPPEDSHSDAYRDGLRRLGEEEKAGFFDISAVWSQYMRGITTPYDFFMRDPVHANDRGRALAARLIAGYFAPED